LKDGRRVDYDAKPAEDVIPPAVEIKQEVIHSEISEADNCMTNILEIPETPMPGGPKIKVLPAQIHNDCH
jgi:hypothetical protein